MKRLLRQVNSAILALLLCGTMTCYASSSMPALKMFPTFTELLEWYNGLSVSSQQLGGVTKPTECVGTVVLGQTPGRVDINFIAGIRITTGSRLVIDNSNLVVTGPPPAIVIESGGVLQIRRWNELNIPAMSAAGSIVVKEGGTLITEGITLPEGMVQDDNLPPATLPPPSELPDSGDGSSNGTVDKPDELPSKPQPKPVLTLGGEVLMVTQQGLLNARVTVPRVDPLTTQTVTIERSVDGASWTAQYTYRWNEDTLCFLSDPVPGIPTNLCSKDRLDGSKTDFQYLAPLSGAPFCLRLVVVDTDSVSTVSNAIQLSEPTVGLHPGNEDYEDSDGNRGGGGQGTTDREEQQSTSTSKPELSVIIEAEAAVLPQKEEIKPAASSSQVDAAPQAALSSSQSPASQAAEQLVEPTMVVPSTTQADTVPEQKRGSTAHNVVAVVVTLALCGGIWILFSLKQTKRMKP